MNHMHHEGPTVVLLEPVVDEPESPLEPVCPSTLDRVVQVLVVGVWVAYVPNAP